MENLVVAPGPIYNFINLLAFIDIKKIISKSNTDWIHVPT